MSSATTSGGPVTGTGPAHPPPRPSGGGGGALWWLIGVPVAAVLLIGWQFVVQTSAEFNATERVTGYRAVLRDLPASVLLFVPVAAGLVLAVRSARHRSRSGRGAIWLHGLGLFAVLWIAISNIVGELRPDDSTALEKAMLPVEAAVAAVVLALCLRAASRPARGARGTATVGRIAVLAPALALVGAAAWLTTAQAVLTHHAGGFVRTGVPGSLAFTADPGTTHVVYAEGNAPTGRDELTVQITGPSGTAVAPRAASPDVAYLMGWRGGWPVATFKAAEPGRYRVEITTHIPPTDAPYAPENPNGTVAVGDDLSTWMRAHEWGSAALLLAGLLTGAGLTARSALRRSTVSLPDDREALQR